MPLFRIAWVTSCLSVLLAYSQSLLKFPNHFSSAAARPLEVSFASASGAPLATASGTSYAVSGLQTTFTEALERSFAFHASQLNSATLPLDIPTCRPLTGLPKSELTAEMPSTDLASPTAPPPPKISQRLGRFMQHLLGRGRSPGELQEQQRLKAVEIAVKPVSEPVSKAESQARQADPRALRAIAVSAVETNPSPEFQVWVNDRAIAQLNDPERARAIAQSLKNAIAEPGFKASAIEPTLRAGTPTAMMGKRTLFAIDDRIAPKNDSNRELLAINWTNHLRVALGAPPLSLIEAQERMYQLEETSQTLAGLASWYGGFFHGRQTANGETYNKHAFTAAHPSLPFDTYLKVTNVKNNNSAIVRINDRGPFIAPRTLDLSWGVAKCMEGDKAGVIHYEATLMKSTAE